MKIRKNVKALSPVVASIILIAVTVAVSIAVAAWMGALTFTFMRPQELVFTYKVEIPNFQNATHCTFSMWESWKIYNESKTLVPLPYTFEASTRYDVQCPLYVNYYECLGEGVFRELGSQKFMVLLQKEVDVP